MKSFSLALLLILCSFFSLATRPAGGVWLLEIEYGRESDRKTTFLYADYWAENLRKFEIDNVGFAEQLRIQLANYQELICYDSLIDLSAIASVASFPMQPFILQEKFLETVYKSELINPKLLKVWSRVDYMINLLSPVEAKDTNWFRAKADTIFFPIGQDVGCRLEVHCFSKISSDDKDLQGFLDFYQNTDDQAEIEIAKQAILRKLYARKVIIVELCGC